MFESWLTSCKQRFVRNGQTSKWLDITNSVLKGPFLLDIKIHGRYEDIEGLQPQTDRDKLIEWAYGWQVNFIIDKCTDIDELIDWDCRWQVNFSIDKCKVSHIQSKMKIQPLVWVLLNYKRYMKKNTWV